MRETCHGVGQTLVAITKVGRQPARGLVKGLRGPLPVWDVQRLELPVFLPRFFEPIPSRIANVSCPFLMFPLNEGYWGVESEQGLSYIGIFEVDGGVVGGGKGGSRQTFVSVEDKKSRNEGRFRLSEYTRNKSILTSWCGVDRSWRSNVTKKKSSGSGGIWMFGVRRPHPMTGGNQ